MENAELLSPCGLYCGVCGIRAAYLSGNERFKAAWASAYGFSPDQIKCDGCCSAAPFFFCSTCQIRDCVSARGLVGCNECDEWPCNLVNNYPFAAAKEQMMRAVPIWKKLGTEAWIEHEKRWFSCSGCGAPLYRGATRCRACGTAWVPHEQP